MHEWAEYEEPEFWFLLCTLLWPQVTSFTNGEKTSLL